MGDYLSTYRPIETGRLSLRDVMEQCLCKSCTSAPDENYDILSSSVHDNIKAGFLRYRDCNIGHKVRNLRLSTEEIQRICDKLSEPIERLQKLLFVAEHLKTQLFSLDTNFMKGIFLAIKTGNSPTYIDHHISMKFSSKKGNVIKGYDILGDSILQCSYCRKVVDTNLDDFMCLRIIDVRTRQTKNSCCVSLEKYSYSIVSYVWSDIERVCADVDTNNLYYGMDGELLSRKMQRLLVHVVAPTCKYVWIDQICIDQDSVLDKELSVTQMHRTYSLCDNCIVCMRKSTVRSLCLSKTAEKECVPDIIGDLDQRIRAYLDYSIIISFINEPWFSRGWTLQECILPRTLLVATGFGVLSIDWAFKYASIWAVIAEHEIGHIARIFSINNAAPYVRSMVMSVVYQLAGIFQAREDKSMTWDAVSKVMAWRRTTVAVDEVYCLRGLLPKLRSIRVDYSVEKTLVLRELCKLYPESYSSLFHANTSDYPDSWRLYQCLPPLEPIEKPTNIRTYVGKCTFTNLYRNRKEGVILTCINKAICDELDMNCIIGDSTYGLIKLGLPDYADENLVEVVEQGTKKGAFSETYYQVEMYSSHWRTGSMMKTPDNRALLAFTKEDIIYDIPIMVWMGDRRSFKTSNYTTPLYTTGTNGLTYIGWSFCPEIMCEGTKTDCTDLEAYVIDLMDLHYKLAHVAINEDD